MRRSFSILALLAVAACASAHETTTPISSQPHPGVVLCEKAPQTPGCPD